jgi:hypothetical protein
MSNPYLTKQEIYDYLYAVCSKLSPPVDVITTYPSLGDNVGYGVYINSINAVNRTPYKLGLQPCGSIYTVTDEFYLIFVSFQNDPNAGAVVEAINTMIEDSDLWSGYHEVDFTNSITFGARNKIRTYVISAKRVNFNITATT